MDNFYYYKYLKYKYKLLTFRGQTGGAVAGPKTSWAAAVGTKVAAPTAARHAVAPTAAPTVARPAVAPTAAPTVARPAVAPTAARPVVAPTAARPAVAPTEAGPAAYPVAAGPVAPDCKFIHDDVRGYNKKIVYTFPDEMNTITLQIGFPQLPHSHKIMAKVFADQQIRLDTTKATIVKKPMKYIKKVVVEPDEAGPDAAGKVVYKDTYAEHPFEFFKFDNVKIQKLPTYFQLEVDTSDTIGIKHRALQSTSKEINIDYGLMKGYVQWLKDNGLYKDNRLNKDSPEIRIYCGQKGEQVGKPKEPAGEQKDEQKDVPNYGDFYCIFPHSRYFIDDDDKFAKIDNENTDYLYRMRFYVPIFDSTPEFDNTIETIYDFTRAHLTELIEMRDNIKLWIEQHVLKKIGRPMTEDEKGNIHIVTKLPNPQYLFPYFEVYYGDPRETYYIRYVDEVRMITLDFIIETLELVGHMKLLTSKFYVYCSHPLYNFSRQQLLKTFILFDFIMPRRVPKIETREQFEQVKSAVEKAIMVEGNLEQRLEGDTTSKPIYNFDHNRDLLDAIDAEFKLYNIMMCDDGHTISNDRMKNEIDLLEKYQIEYIYYFSTFILGSQFYSALTDYRKIFDECSTREEKPKMYPCPGDFRAQLENELKGHYIEGQVKLLLSDKNKLERIRAKLENERQVEPSQSDTNKLENIPGQLLVVEQLLKTKIKLLERRRVILQRHEKPTRYTKTELANIERLLDEYHAGRVKPSEEIKDPLDETKANQLDPRGYLEAQELSANVLQSDIITRINGLLEQDRQIEGLDANHRLLKNQMKQRLKLEQKKIQLRQQEKQIRDEIAKLKARMQPFGEITNVANQINKQAKNMGVNIATKDEQLKLWKSDDGRGWKTDAEVRQNLIAKREELEKQPRNEKSDAEMDMINDMLRLWDVNKKPWSVAGGAAAVAAVPINNIDTFATKFNAGVIELIEPFLNYVFNTKILGTTSYLARDRDAVAAASVKNPQYVITFVANTVHNCDITKFPLKVIGDNMAKIIGNANKIDAEDIALRPIYAGDEKITFNGKLINPNGDNFEMYVHVLEEGWKTTEIVDGISKDKYKETYKDMFEVYDLARTAEIYMEDEQFIKDKLIAMNDVYIDKGINLVSYILYKYAPTLDIDGTKRKSDRLRELISKYKNRPQDLIFCGPQYLPFIAFPDKSYFGYENEPGKKHKAVDYSIWHVDLENGIFQRIKDKLYRVGDDRKTVNAMLNGIEDYRKYPFTSGMLKKYLDGEETIFPHIFRWIGRDLLDELRIFIDYFEEFLREFFELGVHVMYYYFHNTLVDNSLLHLHARIKNKEYKTRHTLAGLNVKGVEDLLVKSLQYVMSGLYTDEEYFGKHYFHIVE